jgi:hypothetical protein
MNTIGDIDGDTYDDIWIAEMSGSPPGRGFIYSGLDQSLIHTVELSTPGSALRDGDGYLDLIVTAPGFDSVATNAGRLSVFYGSATPFTGVIDFATADATIDGPSDSAAFGISLAVLSDIDGDSRPDIAVGASGWETDVTGTVYVYSGSTLAPLYSLSGTIVRSRYGFTMKNAGDVNNDGYEELIIGAAYGGGPGYAEVVSTVDGTVLYHLAGEQDGDAFSWYGLCAPGDLNGDGFADVIVGAYGNDAGGGSAGRVYGFYGGDPGLSPDTINAADADFIITGTSSSFLGYGMGGVGDINGDTVPDFAVGAIYYNLPSPGELRIYSGYDASLIFTIEGIDNYEDFGASCLNPWDLDGDQVKDLLVGAYCQSDGNHGGTEHGRVYGYLIGDRDQDQIMAQCDNCQRYATPGNESMNTGDLDLNTLIQSADVIWLVNYVFKSGATPMPIAEAGDVNHDQLVRSDDIIYMVNHVFKSGPAPLDACAW